MEVPKVLWLKNNMPSELFARCQFFDLPDYLTYLATSSWTRSSGSLACKCAYVPDPTTLPPNTGLPVGRGLSKKAAEDLGLLEGTPIGSGIGTIAARYRIGANNDQVSEPAKQEEAIYRLAAVAAASTCHLIQTPKGHFVLGIWEPYQRLRQQEAVPSLTELTKYIHFYPDLQGNRSPIADPSMTGSITGLTLV
ncbi:hypothetical protein M422DRAFT_61221 [Sphaerobolus stellatus SS14]|uniref:Unplaced genomic scaffold SPHSTscaffold_107, whole genome shotgun sequence n=1 Tax=Sphaerobolus stellatus (strain SS14) TaxID=990650 RepID=A0A0C9VEK2_SPHS4|nr:hypothetical protein M422DRAFT_61221 [Sphaerobolus stellatus SS14]